MFYSTLFLSFLNAIALKPITSHLPDATRTATKTFRKFQAASRAAQSGPALIFIEVP
jgi:hypothetical protein